MATVHGNRSDIYAWDLIQFRTGTLKPGLRRQAFSSRLVLRFCTAVYFGSATFLPGGKRSNIDSWDLIQSVPEPRRSVHRSSTAGKRSNIDSWDLIQSVPEPRRSVHRRPTSDGDVSVPSGKRSGIDSLDLIESIPEPRSLGVCIGVRLRTATSLFSDGDGARWKTLRH